jgi:cyclophilin family peptidyl-prolyl cis-trans isomerase
MWTLALACLTPDAGRAQIGGCVPDLSGSIAVDVSTHLGTIPIELFPNMAPVTVQNFLDYANAGDYDGVIFHRSVPGFVIQAGGFAFDTDAYSAIPTGPTIVAEPCLSNTRGTVAMARLGGQPDSARSQWFVNLTDNLFLDSTDGVGFAVFGRVVGDGMAVVDDIASRPTFDALTILELDVNQVFRTMPLQSLPVEPAGGYGCTREAPLHGLAEQTVDFPVEDLSRSNLLGGTAFVPILLDPACTGSGAIAPPSVPCTPGIGRDAFFVDLDQQVFDPTRIPMTCDQVAESLESWEARRAGTAPQLPDLDIEILSVPEPDGGSLRAAGLLALLLLDARRRARARRPRRAIGGCLTRRRPPG